MRVKTATVCVLALLALAGCGDEEDRRPVGNGVPDVVGLSLEDAKEVLDDAGITYYVGTPSGQTPVIDHLWEVCDQDPAPGAEAWKVELAVDREC
jgi:hypothetical protein